MKTLQFLTFLLFTINIGAQSISGSFEIRYFTDDPKANGETDFKGETEWMNTEQRVQFLQKYASFAAVYFNNRNLDKEIVRDNEVDSLLSKLKPQPLTNIRRTIPLEGWKAYGYKDGQDNLKKKEIKSWMQNPAITISEGALIINNWTLRRNIDSLKWRFRFECKIKILNDNVCSLTFSDRENSILSIRIKKGEINYGSGTGFIKSQISGNGWINTVIEGDLTQKRFNLYINGKLIQDYIPMIKNPSSVITDLEIHSEGETQFDDFFLFNHFPTSDIFRPYISEVVLDENFEEKSPVGGWQKINFDDRKWIDINLPAVHGGLREKDEDFFLRKKIHIDNFERATLVLETLDPGGEIWINNEVAEVIHDRYPHELDITKYLLKNQDNIIAIKVRPYKVNFPMEHTPTDPYVGWFLGRTALVLSSKCMINNVRITTKQIGEKTVQSHEFTIQYSNPKYLEGIIEINYYPWFPEEGGKLATFRHEVKIQPRVTNEYKFEEMVNSPKLWCSDSPNLYKVEFILRDKDNKPVDDFITTTGIRTIEQKNGELFINGKPEMLNGAQIMGYRTPIETISKFHRCPPDEIVAEEMIMIKKMNANLLRIHVHAESDTTDGINDPRYAEMADQMGIYLMWTTGAWTRTSDPWNVDFAGYPEYMKQVYNHPSIVCWEASNHPNYFKRHDLSYTNDFVKKIVRTISSVDDSRLISPTTFWPWTHYGNYDGTLDYNGKEIEAVPEFMEKLVTRGSQDSYSGYGADWSKIRKAPNQWAASCLAAKDKAYFNFEHEESTAQPNWDLSKGKPWYLLQSYEWEYDEGSIGRRLTTSEWKASQAWQAFSAWESMKKQILLGYDGFSWCCLHGGANMGTYQKPLIDNMRHPKLAFYTNKMIFQKTWAGSNNVDVVYGPADKISPVINHIGKEQTVNLSVTLRTLSGKILDQKIFKNIKLKSGHSINQVDEFRFKKVNNGIYAIVYEIYPL
jgi:hypothetical protein